MKRRFNHTKRPYGQWDGQMDDLVDEDAPEGDDYYEEYETSWAPDESYGEYETIEEADGLYEEYEALEDSGEFYEEYEAAEEPGEFYEEYEEYEEYEAVADPGESYGEMAFMEGDGSDHTDNTEYDFGNGEEEYYEYADDLEYYEEDGAWDSDCAAKGNGGGKAAAGMAEFFHHLSGMDRIMMAVGAAALLIACVTGGVFLHARAAQKQISEFVTVGAQLPDIEVIGDRGLLAVADAAAARAAAAELVAWEQEAEQKKEYEEADYSKKVTVALEMVSVQKDLKIKFVNKDTNKLVSNVPFSVTVTTADSKVETWSDDDMDGIIYKKNITPGNYQVTVNALSGDKYEGYTLPGTSQKAEVKKDIAYQKVDVANEVKKESQINLAKEEQKKQELAVESVLEDTVEWVESSSSTSTYIEVPLRDIPSPAALAMQTKSGSFLRMASTSGGDIILPPESDKNTITLSVEPTAVKVAAGSSVNVQAVAAASVQSGDASVGYTVASDNEAVASAEADGSGKVTITGVAEGGARVTVTAALSDGSASASAAVNVEVTAKAKEGISLSATAQTVLVGETATIKAVLSNAASGTAISAASSDTAVASVTVNGSDITIKGVKAGTANITVKGDSASAVCSVTVKANPKNDTTTKLKDKNGNQLYVQENGSYKEAVYADYYKSGIKFYKKGATKYTGWQTIDGKRYYYTAAGEKVTGEQVIQGAKYTFSSDGVLVTDTILGIDVSKHNGSVNWNAVKNSGVSYVIIRCGYRGYTQGSLIEDPMFAQNIKGASAAGLKVGIYFFSQAVDEVEAVQEASFVLDAVRGYNISYPIFLDVEYSGAAGNSGRADGLDKATRTAVCKAFCATIQNGGYKAGVYANKTWLEQKVDPGQLGGYKIWLAQYAQAPTYGGRYDMWQYSSKGSISGISGNVDMNLSYLGY